MFQRDCSICGAAAPRPLFRQQFSGITDGALLKGYDVVSCPTCGFVYAAGIPEQGLFDAYYRDLSKYEHATRGGMESAFDTDRLESIAEVLAPAIPRRDSRILEIGCSTGRLLASLKQKGYTSALGVDPSPTCAEAAQRLYAVQVLACSLSDLPSELRADFIILVGVIEHIPDLERALQRIRALCLPNGRVYVEVPDASRFGQFDDAPFQQLSVEHINFFSAISLTNLMGVNGFRPILSGQAVREQSDTTKDPTVYGVYEVADPQTGPLVRDETAEKGMAAYIRQSEATEIRICSTIAKVVSEGLPILVWGVGTHTQHLMATTVLAKAAITAFVDSNPMYQGKLLNGFPILPPQALAGRSEPILISTRVFQREIERQIREDLKLGNELILLYDL
jgi:SAM-dependent methyltransferase